MKRTLIVLVVAMMFAPLAVAGDSSNASRFLRAYVDMLCAEKSGDHEKAVQSIAEKTVTAFVLDAAMLEAQRALADRHVFRLDPVHWQRFVNALDRPARGKHRLRELMRRSGAV